MIEIKHLTKIYDVDTKNQFKALDDINLTIEDGSIFGIIGLSGAGKSTLVKCLNLLEKPTYGEVIYDGIDLTKLSNKDLLLKRKDIGVIFQNFNLLNQRNVFENIAFPLKLAKVSKDKILERVNELAHLVGMEDKLLAYPSTLSGGQKQRVAIARALASNPKYLICDEATSALDPTTTSQILDLLKTINQKLHVTIVMISHQMSVISSLCQKVAVINRARIEEEGSVFKVFLNPKSEIAKQFVYSNRVHSSLDDKNFIKILFDGNVEEPLLANIVLDCGILVSVVYASSYNQDGKSYGQLIIKKPLDENDFNKLKYYLDYKNVNYQEVSLDALGTIS